MVFTKNYPSGPVHLCCKLRTMKRIHTNTLLDSLESDVRSLLLEATALQSQPAPILETCAAPGKWSVAQVLEHLNIYSRHYIKAIEEKLHRNQSGPNETFYPGWLGNYFTNLMRPQENGTIGKKMKAPKKAVPAPQPDSRKMLEEFMTHQQHLLNLLRIARSANLDYIRIPTTLSKWITLKLGDTFRFFIAHEQRHFAQIATALQQVQRLAVA
jgi:uncharacterized damage-inducible protein DinB